MASINNDVSAPPSGRVSPTPRLTSAYGAGGGAELRVPLIDGACAAAPPTPDVEKSARELRSAIDDAALHPPTQSDEHAKLGIVMSVWNLINDVIAAGAVALPFLVASGGVFLTPLLMAVYCYLCYESLLLIHTLVQRFNAHSFPELAERALGRAGFFWASACIFIFNFGGGVGALIAIGTAVPDLMQNWFPASTAYVTHRSGVIVAAMLVFGPLSLFKSMRRFAPLSMIGVWAIFGLALCIIARFALTYTHAVDAWPVPVPPAHAWRFYQPNFFPAIGGISYIYTCHDMSIHVLHSLHEPTRRRWSLVAGGTMIAAYVISTLLALSGYLLFFTDAAGNILDNFARDDRLVIVCRCLLGVNVLFGIPYSVIMPRVVVSSLIKLRYPSLIEKQDGNRCARNTLHTIVTITLQAAAVALALHVTDLGLFYEIVGGISAISVSLIIPPIIYLSLGAEVAAIQGAPPTAVETHGVAVAGAATTLTTALLAPSAYSSIAGAALSTASADDDAARSHAAMRMRCWVLLSLGLIGCLGCLGSIVIGNN